MANKKAEILTMDGQVVSPITLATNVLLDDGRTAQDLLDSRDESMFSPTITTSSSISKVGQGDNVDFSENVIDGAYGSCVLKGKTLVNYNAEGNDRNEYVCIPSVEGSNLTVNGTVEGKVKSAILKGQTLMNTLSTCINKPLTKTTHTGYIQFLKPLESGKEYTIIISLSNAVTTTDAKCLNVRGNKIDGSYTSIYDAVFKITNGIQKVKFTPTDGFVTCLVAIGSNAPEGSSATIDYFMIIEGDHTNEDIPYFTGMSSVKMPVLTTTGKNFKQGSPIGSFNENNGEYVFTNMSNRNGIRFDVDNTMKIGDTITVSVDCKKNEDFGNNLILLAMNNDVELINKSVPFSTTYERKSLTITIPNNTTHLFLGIGTSLYRNVSFSNIQIEKGSTATSYEPYKTNILSTSEDVELRGIGDVQDTLDCLTGEVTERIGEVVLDGSYIAYTNQSSGGYPSATSTAVLLNLKSSELPQKRTTELICKDLPCYSHSNSIWMNNTSVDIGISSVSSAWDFCIRLPHTLTGGTSTDSNDEIKRKFKDYLNENPITVQYQLATEAIKTVDLSILDQDGQPTKLKTFKDTTHFTCSSQEGSLIPTLTIEEGVKYEAIIKPSTKYSVVFNRTEVASGLTVDLGGVTANITSTTLGKDIVQITTPPTLSHNYVIFKGLGNVIKDVQVIEGEVVGDEPYFEGMADVKNPSVMNCNTLDVDSADYKSNTTSTNEVVLRSLPNGVCDTLDLETGVYVQRIGEVVLDGSEDEGWVKHSTSNTFYSAENTVLNNLTWVLCVCDKMITKQVPSNTWLSFGEVGVFNTKVGIGFNGTLEELIIYLQQNPITVQYELETPIITTIDLKQHPLAYKDGYVVLTSSSEEISLTPTIEYSLIANRLGQIQSNQKLVEKQQAQIDELESMVITNLVNTQYQQALNEIKLGVK